MKPSERSVEVGRASTVGSGCRNSGSNSCLVLLPLEKPAARPYQAPYQTSIRKTTVVARAKYP